MGSLASMYVSIGANTAGFEKSIARTERTMQRVSKQRTQIPIDAHEKTVRRRAAASQPRDERGRFVAKPSIAEPAAQTAAQPIAAQAIAPVNTDAMTQVADALEQSAASVAALLEKAGYRLENVAQAFSDTIVKGATTAVEKLVSAKVGAGYGKLSTSLIKTAGAYVERVGTARIAWEQIYNKQLEMGKSEETARETANTLMAQQVGQMAGFLSKAQAAYRVVKENAQGIGAAFTRVGKQVGDMVGSWAKIFDFGKKTAAASAEVSNNTAAKSGGKWWAAGAAALGTMAASATAIYATFASIRIAWAAISGLFSAAASVLNGIVGIVGGILGAFGSVFSALGSALTSAIGAVGELLGAIGEIGVAILSQIAKPFMWVGSQIMGVAQSVFDYIMDGLRSAAGFIKGVLMGAVVAYLGKLTYDSGIIGKTLQDLRVMTRGGKQVRYDERGEEISEPQTGILTEAVERSSAAIKRFTDALQKTFGKMFEAIDTSAIVAALSGFIDKTLAYVQQMLPAIGTAVLKSLSVIVSIIDSAVGIVRAAFSGDWGGMKAMALETGARISDALAGLLGMVAPYLDQLIDRVAIIGADLLTALGSVMASIETTVRGAMAGVIRAVAWAAGMVADGAAIAASATLGGIDALAQAFPTFASAGGNLFDQNYKPSNMAGEAMEGIYTANIQLQQAMGTAARKVESPETGSGVTDYVLAKAGQLRDAASQDGGLGLTATAADALKSAADTMRDQAAKIAPNAQKQYGGTLDPVQKAIAALQAMLGQGSVVAQQGKVVDAAAAAAQKRDRDLGQGTTGVETVLGTVNLASGAASKAQQIAGKQLSEAEKQTRILEESNKLLQANDPAKYVQVRDEDGYLVSMLESYTKLVTRVDAAGKQTTEREAMSQAEISAVNEAVNVLARSVLGERNVDASGVDLSVLSPQVLTQAYKDAQAQTEKSVREFAAASAVKSQEEQNLAMAANRWLSQIADNTKGGFIPLQ